MFLLLLTMQRTLSETSTVLKEPIGDVHIDDSTSIKKLPHDLQMGESKEHSSGRERNERFSCLLLPFSSLDLFHCQELEFIHKSSSIVGYRPNIFSTTLSHLIATNSYHFLIPFIPIRERLKDKLEEFFNCQYELFVEFTALIRWSRGASIGWHSDDNRPYLKQRHFAVVCYLNNYGKDFNGGLFRFQDGQPMSIMPMAGDVLIYTADQHNIHSVDEKKRDRRENAFLGFKCFGFILGSVDFLVYQEKVCFSTSKNLSVHCLS
ncbi:uncharacterized protein LOC107613843 [Arachis ipaensis]|uniref:uncharacterized protein LOC107613843 n=1 Tax=Arachis ipaensis TaxID=130454 RepID=UPI000A2B80E9|nr:uncharacterized protein LOC107613843 [Arachis ipaensis]